MIRRLGNAALHEARPLPSDAALTALRHLHDLLKWAAYTYSTSPEQVPTSATYDVSQIPTPAASGSQPPLIRERFDLAYPEYAGHFARVITHQTEQAPTLIDDF